MAQIRQRVLRCFKDLHRTRQQVFLGDDVVLAAGRQKINEEFLKNKHLTNQDDIIEQLTIGEDANLYLKEIIQTKYNVDKDVHEVRIRSEHLEDNENYIGGTDPLTMPIGKPTSGGCRQQPPDGDNKS